MSDLKLTIELLPKGAWGNNLRERLKKEDWDTLRNLCYERFDHRCSICGKTDVKLDAHEVWEFDEQNRSQTLKDIIALCPACHGVKHMRNSIRIGYEKQSKAHFLKVNKCNQMTFAKHYAEAIYKFEELNKVLRWELIANLDKFSGSNMDIKQREIPLIEDPYYDVDWSTVKHIIADDCDSVDLKCNFSGVKAIIFRPSMTTNQDSQVDNSRRAVYFVAAKLNALPPKICSIEVDNYVGTISIVTERTNKIQWISDNKVIKTKYNINGKFTTKFSVENLECSKIKFILSGEGGETISETFMLYKAI